MEISRGRVLISRSRWRDKSSLDRYSGRRDKPRPVDGREARDGHRADVGFSLVGSQFVPELLDLFVDLFVRKCWDDKNKEREGATGVFLAEQKSFFVVEYCISASKWNI